MKQVKTIIFLIIFIFCSVKMSAQTNTVYSDSIEVPDSIYPQISLKIQNQHENIKDYYFFKIHSFQIAPLEKGDIVFLGNSITEGGGNWAKRFNNFKIKNRGISGDITDGVLSRLGEIYFFQPSAVFILIGINDLFNPNISGEYVGNNVLKIANNIHEKCPKTQIFIQTILPTQHPEMILKIKKANDIIKNKIDRKTMKLLNLHKVFANDQDLLLEEYTYDGLHLNEEGYKLWVEAIRKYVESIKN